MFPVSASAFSVTDIVLSLGNANNTITRLSDWAGNYPMFLISANNQTNLIGDYSDVLTISIQSTPVSSYIPLIFIKADNPVTLNT